MLRRAVVLCLLARGTATGQILRGAVRDSAANAPLPGVVVTLLDASGSNAGRAITGAGGRFTLPRAPNAVRVRLIRIGYRPRDLALSAVAGDSLFVAMEKLPPLLEVVRVTGSELCPGSNDRGAAFELWEQARAGLLATIVAREQKPAMVTTIVYESGLSPTDELVRRQSKTIRSGRTTRPFAASAPPSHFAAAGYMTEDRSGRTFNAPDAEVLTDESFAATHCFRLQPPDRAHEGQAGIAFAPVSGRDTLVDVKGVIWIDVATPQLRSLDFLYTSLEPAAMQARTGGEILFQNMPNGVAFIGSWHLRLPNMYQMASAQSSVSVRRIARDTVQRVDRYGLRVGEVVEKGGVVIDARWDDGQTWHIQPAIVKGVVVRQGTGAAVEGGVVSLEGTGDTTFTNARGEFELPVVPGRYGVSASDTTLVDFARPRSRSTVVTVGPGITAQVRLEVASLSGVVRDLCHDDHLPENTSIIVGVVSLASGAVPRDALVVATWQAGFVKRGDNGIDVNTRNETVSIDDHGRFLVCGVSRERPIGLSLRRKQEIVGDTTALVPGTDFTHRVLWIVKPKGGG